MKHLPILVATVFAAVGAPPALSAPEPVGPEFQVNTYTSGTQLGPDIAADPDGGFVIAWWGNGGSPETDSSESSIQGRRFDRSGAPVGGQFQVNTYGIQ